MNSTFNNLRSDRIVENYIVYFPVRVPSEWDLSSYLAFFVDTLSEDKIIPLHLMTKERKKDFFFFFLLDFKLKGLTGL